LRVPAERRHLLVEDGRLFISDPIAKFVAEFAGPRVGVERNGKLELVAAERAITIQDLLRHTSGLTYAFTGNALVQRLYGESQLFTPDPANAKEFLARDLTTAEFVTELAKLPLIDQPGPSWNYSHSTDVIGRVIEIVSGQSLGAFLDERIFKPLGMRDTSFFLPAEKRERLAEPFANDPDTGKPVQLIEAQTPPRFESGGGGLFSTMDDYVRFAQMLYLKGTVGSTRFLGRKTLEYMTSDHLGPDVRIVNTNLLPPGHRFGLGFAVRREPGRGQTPGTPGEFFWGGLAGTVFWIAPQEELIAMMMIQARLAPAPTRSITCSPRCNACFRERALHGAMCRQRSQACVHSPTLPTPSLRRSRGGIFFMTIRMAAPGE
jgi:CubicO group peptidase (beta-lactamase class C family)